MHTHMQMQKSPMLMHEFNCIILKHIDWSLSILTSFWANATNFVKSLKGLNLRKTNIADPCVFTKHTILKYLKVILVHLTMMRHGIEFWWQRDDREDEERKSYFFFLILVIYLYNGLLMYCLWKYSWFLGFSWLKS